MYAGSQRLLCLMVRLNFNVAVPTIPGQLSSPLSFPALTESEVVTASMAPTANQVLDIARKAIKIFAKHGLKCCLIGSTASYLYGVPRTPNVSMLAFVSTCRARCQRSL